MTIFIVGLRRWLVFLRHQIEMIIDAIFECLLKPFKIVTHEDLIAVLARRLVIEQLDHVVFVLQVVAFDLAERGHELKALSVVEDVVHLQGSRLQSVETSLEE